MESTLRILFLVTAYPSEAQPIPGVFLKTMAESIHELGVDVDVVAPVPFVPSGFDWLSSRWRNYHQIPKRYSLNGISVHRPRSVQIPRGDYYAFPHVFYQLASQASLRFLPDIVHSHYAYPPGLAALGLSRKWGIPNVLTLHGSDVNRYPEVNSLAMRRFRKAVKGATCVTSVSTALAKRTRELCGRTPEVIRIGINLESYLGLPSKEEARRQLGLPLGRRLALFVGSLVPEKGVRELLDALGRLSQQGVLGVFVGDGPLRSEIVASGRATCVGSQQHERVSAFMRACDVFVLPSHSEGMPTVLIEAGAVGLPVVATPVGGIPELLDDERGFLTKDTSSDSVVDAIREVLESPTIARARSDRMRAFVFANYDARANAAQMVQKYRNLTAANSMRLDRRI